MKLENQIALVTGAGSGLGRAICLAFAREGAHLVVNDIRLDIAEETARMVRELGREAVALAADVSDSVEVAYLFERLKERWPRLDILVNNAGIVHLDSEVQERIARSRMERLAGQPIATPVQATSSLSDSDWRRVLAVHLDGTFYCTREALKLMEAQRRGKIINMASVAGLTGLLGDPAYSAAKAGIIGFTKAVAREAILVGIHVNAIAPGFIDTPLIADLSPAIKEWIALQTPAGRIGTAEEVAATALFLASSEADYFVGQVLSPNGGLVM
jgi:3-oxoacyl-[acyl-carrier protein] reductase